MAKVHPIESQPLDGDRKVAPAAMTVWKKSLLFNCSGFTVYGAEGNLLFRVDNYSSSRNREIVLMNSSGMCLMTIRRKRLSLSEEWFIYDGEETSNPQFSIKKHTPFNRSKVLARVASSSTRSHRHSYSVEGSYMHHRCTIFDDRRKPVGEVKRKEVAPGVALGCDVFHLVVESEMDAVIAMAIVIVLDQMYGS